MSTQLTDLDTHSLLHIFTFLNPIDILSITKTCQRLHEVAYLVPSIRFEACLGPKYLTLCQTEALLQIIGNNLISLSAWLDQKKYYTRLFEQYCPKLRHLHLVCFNIHQARSLKNVFGNLHTQICHSKFDAIEFDESVGCLQNLEHITFETEDSGIQLAGFSDLKLLHDVQLCGQNLKVDQLIDLFHVNQLRCLIIDQVKLNCDSIKKLAVMNNLEVLSISDAAFTDDQLKLLNGNSVRSLKLSDCQVTSLELAELMTQSNKLESLELRDIKGSEGLKNEYLNNMKQKVIVSVQ